ncbi:MAG: hypothetical protein CL732_07570 [Chloroflexi bacterium]|nr:hypothetical protein [Chloroflexota bacterium]
MANCIIRKCSIGHTWMVPLNGTTYVSMPDGCRKCIKNPNPVVAAFIEFKDNNAPSVLVDNH